MDLVYSDVWGPSPVLKVNENCYYVFVVEALSCFTWPFPIQQKSDVMFVFLEFQTIAKHLLNTKIKSVQTYWGGEYSPFINIFNLSALSIVSHALTQINSKGALRENIMLLTLLSTFLLRGVPKRFWDESYETYCYLIKWLPTPLLAHASLFAKLFSKQPDYNFLKVFGSACFPNLRPYNSNKFDFLLQTLCIFRLRLTPQGLPMLSPIILLVLHLSRCRFS